MNTYRVTYYDKSECLVKEVVLQIDVYTSVASALNPDGTYVNWSNVVLLGVEMVPRV